MKLKHSLTMALLVCITLSFTGTIAQNLVLHYPFDGNANDVSGQGNHGTVTGATLTYDRNFEQNKAYLFNSLGESITANAIAFPSGKITVSAWVKPAAFYQGNCQVNMIIGNNGSINGQSNGKWYLMYSDNLSDGNDCSNYDANGQLPSFRLGFTDGSAVNVASPEAVELHKWYHLVGTYDGSTMRFYVNGVLKKSQFVGKTMDVDNSDISIGKDLTSSSYPYNVNGTIDDIRIYTDALSSSDIDDLYKTRYYRDADFDGFGNPSVWIESGSRPKGYVLNDGDCNDNNANINPNATEICDGIDNNCDGQIDEGIAGTTYYEDYDGDGYGNPRVSIESCTPVSGYVTNNLDCLDFDAQTYPGAPELCDNRDNDCDGQIDEGLLKRNFYEDDDGDGFGNPSVYVYTCSAPQGFVANNQDCNDSNSAVHPNAPEICDGIDNNCDGIIDSQDCCIVADYPLDGNANDVSGNGHHGSVTSGVSATSNRNNLPNKALYFNSKNDYVTLPGQSFGTGKITVAAWVNPSAFYQGACQTNIIIANDGRINGISNGKWYMSYSDNLADGNNCGNYDANNQLLSFRLGFTDGTAVNLASTFGAQLNRWYFLTGSYDGQVMKFYIDGALVKQQTVNKTLDVNGASSIYVARDHHNTYSYNVTGSIDDIKLYDCALTNSGIQNLYNSSSRVAQSAPKESTIVTKSPEFTVSPNPTSAVLNINTTESQVGWNVEIYNLQGKRMFTGNLDEVTQDGLDVSKYQSGVYILKLTNGDKQVIKRFVRL